MQSARSMTVRSIRRLTADKNHNAFTGAAWFRGALYVAFRQGDAHVCEHGHLVVMRSRDEGAHFDTVAVMRGKRDTRDAHLYTDGERRLYIAGFEAPGDGEGGCSGSAWTEDGLQWSPWTRMKGTTGYIMWRPRCFQGSFFCAGYGYAASKPGEYWVDWFESSDGLNWRKRRPLHRGPDRPNECVFDFFNDGSIAMLMRCEHADKHPLLLRSAPPYTRWRKTRLDVPLLGPALWLVGDDIWIAGRWLLPSGAAHIGVFKIIKNKPELQFILPSGPGWDLSYVGAARHPNNTRRFALSYYSGHIAGDDPNVSQWDHPDIYLADVVFAADYLGDWQVSDILTGATLRESVFDQASGWRTHAAYGDESPARGFVDASARIAKKTGVVVFRKEIDVGPTDAAYLHLGYDGPVLVRLNAKLIHQGVAGNPALPDHVSVPVNFRHGVNCVEIALDTNNGRACGIFARWEPAAPARKKAAPPCP